MKFSLVAVLVVLAIAHGTESSSLVKRDVSTDMEKLVKYFQDMSTMVSKTAEEAIENLKASELTSQAQTYLEGGRTQFLSVADMIQENADKIIKEQIEPLVSSFKEQVQPMADNLQAQIQPLTENLQSQAEQFYQTVVDKTMALLPPQ